MKDLPFKNIAVYCGSNSGKGPEFGLAGQYLAKAMAEAQMTLIYGGAKVGLMGLIANNMLERGGRVIGVMPQALADKEVSHDGLTDLFIVNSMHERKAMIAEKADAFILFPGGPGSWEEFFEMITWAKLGHHQKPCGILNINNYYDKLIQFLDHAVDKQFLHEAHRQMILIDDCPKGLFRQFIHYKAPTVSAWMENALA